ncbi:MAG: S1 RNA-binding domain-containing protein, partial [Duodenibacillus sp.]|nr:S1 RNA-binding domain-containing protein [Duodenibacillus sp.]
FKLGEGETIVRDAWNTMGNICSAAERRADEAERDADALLKCRFAEKLAGEYAATVTTVMRAGVYAQLDESFVEGFIPLASLGPDYYVYDEDRAELRGERGGEALHAGARIRVAVDSVDVDDRSVVFKRTGVAARGPARDRWSDPAGAGEARRGRPAHNRSARK